MDAKRIKEALLRKKCAKDPVFFINNFVMTEDPRPGIKQKVRPFKLYDYQVDYVRKLHKCYKEGKDIFTDKSRDMGATWSTLAFVVWLTIFEENSQILIGSRKEEFVDNAGLPSTLFGKIDIILRYLPKFLKNFRPLRTNMKLILQKKQLINGVERLSFWSSVSGESCNDNFSVSGRYGLIFLDEFSKWERGTDKLAWGQTADTTNCRIVVGTPMGMGNEFATIRHGKSIKDGYTEYINMHWRVHPDKNKDAWFDEDKQIWRSPWYDNEINRRQIDEGESLQLVKQELDCHYIQSGQPVFPHKYLVLRKNTFVDVDQYDKYSMGIDFASEDGIDRQSIDILSKRNGMQIYHWDGNISYESLFQKIKDLYYKFNKCLIVPEANKDGGLISRLLHEGIGNIYVQRREDSRTRRKTNKFGFYMTGHVGGQKQKLVMKTVNKLELNEVAVTNPKTVEEMRVYQDEGNGKYNAPKGFHDDRVVSFLLAVEGLNYLPKVYDQEESIARKMEAERRKKQYKPTSIIAGF